MEKALLRAQHKDRVLGKVMAWRKNNRAKRCSLRVLAEKIGATLGEVRWCAANCRQKRRCRIETKVKVLENAPKEKNAAVVHRKYVCNIKKKPCLSSRAVRKQCAPLRKERRAQAEARRSAFLTLWGDNPVSCSRQAPWR